jgi:hypothetical protein
MEGSIYATSSLHSQGSGPFTFGTQRGETSGAYFPFGADGDFPHLSSSYGSETVPLEEPAEEGSKKKKVALAKKGLAEKGVLTMFFIFSSNGHITTWSNMFVSLVDGRRHRNGGRS